jgi:NACHT domain
VGRADPGRASRGALGGANNELGSELRARIGALLAATIISQVPLTSVGCPVPFVGLTIAAESDESVDDLVVRLDGGGKAFLQVKRSAKMDDRPKSALVRAIKQFAAAVRGGLDEHDYLVLASANPSRPLRDLGELLDRERTMEPGGRVQRERVALEAFEAIAGDHLDRAELDELLAHLVIWSVDPTQGSEKALLAARLEAELVKVGSGDDAARELADVIRALARLRGGVDRVGLVRGLFERNVAFRPSADPRSVVARAQALAAHRDRELERGTTLRLFAVPPSLQHLPLVDADAKTLVTVDAEARRGQALAPLLRRFGRVLLVGAPGGGKSTALRATAARWARWGDWPVPITIELRRLATRWSQTGSDLTQAMLDLACESAIASERLALRAALEHELDEGRCLLLLDGLDEINAGRVAFVERINTWQKTLPESTELLVTTRPTVAEDATPLALRQLTLMPPDHPWETVSAILEAAAPPDDRASWIRERRRWVDAAFKRDPALQNTPLTVVILATTAVLSPTPAELPRTRAMLLLKALDDVVDRWEITQRAEDAVTIGPLTGTRGVASMQSVRGLLCEAALGSQRDEDDVRELIVQRLASDFSLQPGDAQAAADDALAFWFTTGLFAINDHQITARNRPLAEVGLATTYTRLDDHRIDAFVAESRGRRERWPLLSAAAGLSRQIAETWSRAIATDGTPDELIEFVEAVRDGALVDQDALAAAVEQGLRTWLDASDDAEPVAEAIIEMPLPDTLRSRIRNELLDRVSADRTIVVEALMITSWNETGPTAESTLRQFVSRRRPEPERPEIEPPADDSSVWEFVLPESDDLYRVAHEAACLRLALGIRADAELAASFAEKTSLDYHLQLRKRLKNQGHDDLAEQLKSESAFNHVGNWFGDIDFDATIDSYLRLIADLASPAELSEPQKRKMDDLADCFATAQLNWIHPRVVKRRPHEIGGWISATARLSGFDISVLSAQAQLLVREIDSDAEERGFPFDHGVARDAVGWSMITDIEQTRSALAAVVGLLPQSADHQLTLALASAPSPERAAPAIERLLEKTHNDKTLRFAWMLLVCTEKTDAEERASSWSEADDPMLRGAAARWWSYRAATTGRVLPLFDRALSDQDECVRMEGLAFLRADRLTDALRERIEELAAAPLVGWKCGSCGAHNTAGSTCRSCSVVGADITQMLDKLLERQQQTQKTPRVRPRTSARRLTRRFEL